MHLGSHTSQEVGGISLMGSSIYGVAVIDGSFHSALLILRYGRSHKAHSHTCTTCIQSILVPDAGIYDYSHNYMYITLWAFNNIMIKWEHDYYNNYTSGHTYTKAVLNLLKLTCKTPPLRRRVDASHHCFLGPSITDKLSTLAVYFFFSFPLICHSHLRLVWPMKMDHYVICFHQHCR